MYTGVTQSVTVCCVIVTQESLDNYRGCTSDPFVTEVEKLVLVSQCSKIMDVSE